MKSETQGRPADSQAPNVPEAAAQLAAMASRRRADSARPDGPDAPLPAASDNRRRADSARLDGPDAALPAASAKRRRADSARLDGRDAALRAASLRRARADSARPDGLDAARSLPPAEAERAAAPGQPLPEPPRPERGRPLHGQLEASLRNLIHSGQVEPGARLPGEHELAAHFGVSRHTIRHALGVLAQEGLVRRQRGRGGGTRVARSDEREPLTRSLTGFYAFAWEVQARGAAQRSYVLERTTIAASAELAERLAVAPGSSLERIVRLRTADGEPLVLETSFLPEPLAQGLDQDTLERGSIYDALERVRGMRVVRARETIRPVTLERNVARLLGVRSGSPAFAIDRSSFSESGPIEWQESIVRGDRYLYSVELSRESP